MLTSEVRLRVRYAESDQMRVVYHSNYLVWMEMGRTELCRSLGVRYRDMEENDGILLTVAAASCRYILPARYDDEIVVRATVARASSRLIEFAYEIRNAETGTLLVTGTTTHIPCNKDMRPCRLPEKYRQAFGVHKALSA